MLSWYSIQCRWGPQILSEISVRWKRRELASSGLGCSIVGFVVRNPFPGWCLPCWESTEGSVLCIVSTDPDHLFSASIVGSKLTGTATVRDPSDAVLPYPVPVTHILRILAPLNIPILLSTTIHRYPLPLMIPG